MDSDLMTGTTDDYPEPNPDSNSLVFDDTVAVKTTKDILWATISDPETLTKCVPGADNITRISPRAYTCEITRKITHITFSLSGEVEFVEMHEPDWIIASGTAYDDKTHSEFQVLSAMELEQVNDCTVNLSYRAEMTISGGLTSLLGTRIFRPLVQSDVDTYFNNLTAEIEDNG